MIGPVVLRPKSRRRRVYHWLCYRIDMLRQRGVDTVIYPSAEDAERSTGFTPCADCQKLDQKLREVHID